MTIKTILVASCALSLTGCATLQNVGQSICENEMATRTALEIALNKAYDITNPERRQATIIALNASLSALDQC